MDMVKKLESVGAKVVQPPKTLHKNHVVGDIHRPTQKLLVAVLYGPFGQTLKEITSPYMLRCVQDSPVAKTYLELDQEAVKATYRKS